MLTPDIARLLFSKLIIIKLNIKAVWRAIFPEHPPYGKFKSAVKEQFLLILI